MGPRDEGLLELLFSGAVGDNPSTGTHRIVVVTDEGSLFFRVMKGDRDDDPTVLSQEWCDALAARGARASARRFCPRGGVLRSVETGGIAYRSPKWRRGVLAYVAAEVESVVDVGPTPLRDLARRAARPFAVAMGRRGIKVDGENVSANFRAYARGLIEGEMLCDVFGSSSGASMAVAANAGGGVVAFVNGLRCDRGEHVDGFYSAVEGLVGGGPLCRETLRRCLGVVICVSVPSPDFREDRGQRELASLPGVTLKTADVAGGALRALATRQWVEALGAPMVGKEAAMPGKRQQGCFYLAPHGAPRTLLVAHGDAARETLLCGLAALGREHAGALLLHNLPPNLRRMSKAKATTNAEAQALREALVLDGSWAYERVVVVSDRSSEGVQLCGLVLNALAVLSPEVALSDEARIYWFAPDGDYDPMADWSHAHSDWAKRRCQAWRHEGGCGHFGAATPEALRALFARFEARLVALRFSGESCSEALDLFYGARASSARRDVVMAMTRRREVEHIRAGETRSYGDLLRVEVAKAYVEHALRSIPSAVDGLTPTRRAVLWHFLRSPAGYRPSVAHAAAAIFCSYPQGFFGDQSVSGAIVSMAQRHVGTGNAPLLEALGLFGSRAFGPSSHASERQMRVRLARLATYIFPDELRIPLPRAGNLLLAPSIPVIPTVLLNGASVIASGFCSVCPQFSLPELCRASREALAGEPLRPLTPSFRGFRGHVERRANAVVTVGRFQRDGRSVVITELPVGRWTEQAMDFYRGLAKRGEPRVVSARDLSTAQDVRIELELQDEPEGDEGLVASLRLTSSFSLEQLWLMDGDAQVRRYGSPEDIVREHARARLEGYEKILALERDGEPGERDITDPDGLDDESKTSAAAMWEADLLSLESAYAFAQRDTRHQLIS